MAKVTIELDSNGDADMLARLFAPTTASVMASDPAPIKEVAEQAAEVEKALVEKKARVRKDKEPSPLPTGMPEAPTPSKESLDDPLPESMKFAEDKKPEAKLTINEVEAAAQVFYESAGAAGFRSLLNTNFAVSRWRDVPEDKWPELMKLLGARG